MIQDVFSFTCVLLVDLLVDLSFSMSLQPLGLQHILPFVYLATVGNRVSGPRSNSKGLSVQMVKILISFPQCSFLSPCSRGDRREKQQETWA